MNKPYTDVCKPVLDVYTSMAVVFIRHTTEKFLYWRWITNLFITHRQKRINAKVENFNTDRPLSKSIEFWIIQMAKEPLRAPLSECIFALYLLCQTFFFNTVNVLIFYLFLPFSSVAGYLCIRRKYSCSLSVRITPYTFIFPKVSLNMKKFLLITLHFNFVPRYLSNQMLNIYLLFFLFSHT